MTERNYELVTLYLDEARANKEINWRGGYLKPVAASSLNANVSVSIGSRVDNDLIYINKDKEIRTPFESLFLTHSAQAGEWIQFALAASREDFEYIDNGGGSVSGIVAPVKTQGGNTGAYGTVSVGVAPSIVIAANSSTTGWIVKNNSANVIYLGTDNAVAVGTGYPINPQESIGWDATCNLYAIAGSAGNDLRYMKASVV